MFKRILLATDGSGHSKEALKYARDLALSGDARVFVVHAVSLVPVYPGEPWMPQNITDVYDRGKQLATRAVEELQQAGVEGIVEVLEGPPADAILRVARIRECDLIVMGCRGRGELTSLLLGSVSHRVLAHARAPVLIVRATEDEEAGQDSLT